MERGRDIGRMGKRKRYVWDGNKERYREDGKRVRHGRMYIGRDV